MAQAVKAGYWFCQSNFPVANIKSSLFTHLFASFAVVNPTTYNVTFPTGYEDQFQSFTEKVQALNPNVKTLLSIGGGGDSNIPSTFASMTSQAEYRRAFITSSLNLVNSSRFDGLCINWQYPYTSQEMSNLGTLFTELRATAGDQLLITADVFYSSEYWSSLKYPIQAIVDNLNWINVMAYDMFTPNCAPKLTGPPAPLYNPTIPKLGVDAGITAWIAAGVAANKLVLGLPFHGRNWLLVNRDNKELFSPAKEAADIDPIPYRTIATMKPIPVVVPSYVTCYFSAGTKWINYDSPDIIATKVQFAKEKRLLGYFAWHVANDTDPGWTLSTNAFLAWDSN